MSRLVVVTNRVPAADELARLELGSVAVGGLVSAVKSMMLRQRGLWLGWSGRSTSRGRPAAPGATHSAGPVDLVTIDLTEDELNLYYTGFSNRTLWPLLHGFVECCFVDAGWRAKSGNLAGLLICERWHLPCP